MNYRVAYNFAHLKSSLLGLLILLLAVITFFLAFQNVSDAASYSQIQKDCFFFLNSKLSQFPNLIYNLTQLGDALIFLSILSIFIVPAPKMWEALIFASLFSLIFSTGLKNWFSVPRPAATFDHSSFVIIGKALPGHSSLPSGHSITVFTFLTVLLFALMPKKNIHQFFWTLLILIIGFSVAFTRVGVGAHYPIDVVVGSILGYISGLLGIFIMRKIHIFSWIGNKKYYPFFILLFIVCSAILVSKILAENLVIFYFSLIGLLISLYKITTVYVKK
jgi:membrane-associated phospholipid phosphatase